MRYLVHVHFHHNVESVAGLVSADDRDSAENAVFGQFEAHEDWAVESVEVVREAGAEDEATFQDVALFN